MQQFRRILSSSLYLSTCLKYWLINSFSQRVSGRYKINVITGLIIFNTYSTAQAQIASQAVTEVITSFGGFWQSSNTAISTVKPNNSHDLLAFTYNNKRFSTAVNDPFLISNNISYTQGHYQALPSFVISGNINTNTKVGLGSLYDGVANGPSTPAPSRNFQHYFTDGANGLNLGTGMANIPVGTLKYTFTNLLPSAIGDGKPDLIVTQIADPSGSADKYQFLNAAKQTVGHEVTITFTNIPVIGRWISDFYEASNNPMTLGLSFTSTQRDIRVWAADYSDFGLTADNIASVKTFQIRLSGSSDVAFVAYNVDGVKDTPLPIQLISFESKKDNNQVQLTWQTASEKNSAYYEVETSSNGNNFTSIAKVPAAGTSSTLLQYSFVHRNPFIGTNYYRLRQVDTDSTQSFSPVIAETFDPVAFQPFQVQVMPNPFQHELDVILSGIRTKPVKGWVQIHTLDGRLVYQQDISSNIKSGRLHLSKFPGLPTGMYLLTCRLDNQQAVIKLVKQ